jgi:uncharacterized membrane protein
MNNTSNLKDILTTILGVIVVISGIIQAYIQSLTGPIDWVKLGGLVAIGVVAYFTGKTPAGTIKTPELVAKQNNPKPQDIHPDPHGPH